MPVIEIPDDVYDAIDFPEGEREEALRRELAVALYARGVVSFGKARGLAGMSAWGFHELLGERGIDRHYGLGELDEDLRYARG